MWCHMPIIPAHKGLSQEDCCKLEASLEYTGKKGKEKKKDSLGVGNARESKALTCSEHRPEPMCTQTFPLLVENLLQSVKLCGTMSSVQPEKWPLYLSYEPLLEPGVDKMPLFLLWATVSALAISVICRVCDLSTDAGGSR